MKHFSITLIHANKRAALEKALDNDDYGSFLEDQEDDGSIYQHLAAKGVSMTSVYCLT